MQVVQYVHLVIVNNIELEVQFVLLLVSSSIFGILGAIKNFIIYNLTRILIQISTAV